MKLTKIYQTLEHRNNNEEIENHGPYFCSLFYENKKIKTGAKTPWLGEGYYFWDTRLENAKWWGETIYKSKGYVICQTLYDAHSPLLYDLLGDLKSFDEFVSLAEEIKKKNKKKKVNFSFVLQYLKKLPDFNYSAIRVLAVPNSFNSTTICFPKSGIYLAQIGKVQICFFDKRLLKQNFRVVETHPCSINMTI